MKKSISHLMILGPAMVMSLSAGAADSTTHLGAFEYGITAKTNITKDVNQVQDLEFIGGVLIAEGIKGVIKLELEGQDLGDLELEAALEEMKLSIAIDEVTGNPRALITNLDVGIIKAVFQAKGSENTNQKNNLLFDLSDSDRGVVGVTMELNTESMSIVTAWADSIRVSVYEAGTKDGFDVADEKAVSAEVRKQIGNFAVQFSTKWKEMASEDAEWTNQLAVVWDKGEGYRVWGSAIHMEDGGVLGADYGLTAGAAYDTTFGTLFAEAEHIPDYANTLTLGVNYDVDGNIVVSPYVQMISGDGFSDDPVYGVNLSISLYKKAERAFLQKKI